MKVKTARKKGPGPKKMATKKRKGTVKSASRNPLSSKLDVLARAGLKPGVVIRLDTTEKGVGKVRTFCVYQGRADGHVLVNTDDGPPRAYRMENLEVHMPSALQIAAALNKNKGL